MKSPFKKLRDFAVSKHSKVNESSSFAPEEESEDVTQGMQITKKDRPRDRCPRLVATLRQRTHLFSE